jgi:hypothetical protein
MKHLKPYELLESSGKNLSNFSNQKYKAITGNDSAPGFTGWIYGLLKGLQNNFDNMENYFKNNIYVKTKDGQTIDTGLGFLLGAVGSLATGVLSKIFEPGDFISKNQNWGSSGGKEITAPKTEAEVKPEHLRLMNNKFIEQDLPNITSDTQMKDYIGKSYKRWGIAPGQSQSADDLIATNANTYFNKISGYPVASKLPSVAAETGEISTISKVVSAAESLPIIP